MNPDIINQCDRCNTIRQEKSAAIRRMEANVRIADSDRQIAVTRCHDAEVAYRDALVERDVARSDAASNQRNADYWQEMYHKACRTNDIVVEQRDAADQKAAEFKAAIKAIFEATKAD